MDSASHQNYTRKWANELNCPVFSVDYRLAPGNPYPDPVNDCYQAYVWIVTQAEKQLDMKLEHIIFAGDSAGGHLTMSVAVLAILRGFRKPDSIFSHYPAFSTEVSFLPSALLSVDEWLLTEAFMGCVMGCFLRNGGNPDVSVLASPMVAPEALLNLLPRVFMTCCEADPLRD